MIKFLLTLFLIPIALSASGIGIYPPEIKIKEIIPKPHIYDAIRKTFSPTDNEKDIPLGLQFCVNEIIKLYHKDTVWIGATGKVKDLIPVFESRNLKIYELINTQPKFLQALLYEQYPVLVLTQVRVQSIKSYGVDGSSQKEVSEFSAPAFDVLYAAKAKILNSAAIPKDTRTSGIPDQEEISLYFLSAQGYVFPSLAKIKTTWAKSAGFIRKGDIVPDQLILKVYLILPGNVSQKKLLKRIEKSGFESLKVEYKFPKFRRVK